MTQELIRTESQLPSIDLTNAIESAVTLGRDGVEVLERLQSILKMERDHAAELAFNVAKNELLRRLRPIPKNRRAVINDGFSFRYADLPQIEKSLREAGAYELGFSWYWDTEYVGDLQMSVCVLEHDAGHSRKSRFQVQADARGNRAISDAQKDRAATSYADRITLQRVFGISHLTEETDEPMKAKSRNVETVTPDEALTLEARCREVAEALNRDPSDNLSRMLTWAGVDSVDEFPRSKYAEALKILAGRAQ